MGVIEPKKSVQESRWVHAVLTLAHQSLLIPSQWYQHHICLKPAPRFSGRDLNSHPTCLFCRCLLEMRFLGNHLVQCPIQDGESPSLLLLTSGPSSLCLITFNSRDSLLPRQLVTLRNSFYGNKVCHSAESKSTSL